MNRLLLLLALAFSLAACGDKDKPGTTGPGTDTVPAEHPDEAAHDHDHDHDGAHGGHVIELGEHLAHAEVVLDHDAKTLAIWITDADMKPVATDEPIVLNLVHDGAPVQLTGEANSGKDAYVFRHDAFAGDPEGRLRIKIGGATYNPELETGHHHDDDDDDHAHDHDHGHEHGRVVGVKALLKADDGSTVGHVELALHDDAGDLELRLTKDADGHEPLDLPLDTAIEVAIGEGAAARTVVLRARDTDTNPDESGATTVRSGKTNYFVFPGETGADASWLKGPSFRAPATLRVPSASGTWTASLTLVPHKH